MSHRKPGGGIKSKEPGTRSEARTVHSPQVLCATCSYHTCVCVMDWTSGQHWSWGLLPWYVGQEGAS